MTSTHHSETVAEALARRRSLLAASAMTNAILATEFIRFWWQGSDDMPMKVFVSLLGALLLVLIPRVLISMIVERSGIGEFPLAAWLVASAVPLTVAVIVGRALGSVDLVVCVAAGVSAAVLATKAFRRPREMPAR